MLNFVPNIVVLNYLRDTNQLTNEIEQNVKHFTEIGYQRELAYKHTDGSFSAFGASDESGSTWLTAFVVKSFRQAADHISISEGIIASALSWLSEAQTDEGNFQEKGNIIHKEMQGGLSGGIALTAYVLVAFLENQTEHPQFNGTIANAIRYIGECHTEVVDQYALGVLSYALQHTDASIGSDILDRFVRQARVDSGQMWWEKGSTAGAIESKTINTELSAYGLLALMKSSMADSGAECLAILRWLLGQRNSNGGFEGTQDTIVGLEALAKFAGKFSARNYGVRIGFESSVADASGSFEVNAENLLVRQSQIVGEPTFGQQNV